MKKILVIGHEASLTGAPKLLLDIVKNLKNHNYEIMFVLGKSGKILEEYQKIAPTELWNLDTSEYPIVKKLLYRIKRLGQSPNHIVLKKIKEYNPDLIFNNTIVNGEILEMIMGGKNYRVLSMIHEMESVIKMFNRNGNSDKVLKFSNYFIVPSDAVKNNLILNHQVAPNKIKTIHGFVNPINKEILSKNKIEIQQELNIKETDFVVSMCGNLIYRKGFDFFIELASIVHKNGHSDIKFVWVGGKKNSGTYFEIKEEIRKRGLSECVTVVHETPEILSYYSCFDIFFLSSREDPFPLTMLEAAQFELPILGFKQSGGVEEFLQNGGGLLSNYGDVQDVYKNLMKLKNDKLFYKQCCQEIKKNNENFTVEKSQKQISDYINNILTHE